MWKFASVLVVFQTVFYSLGQGNWSWTELDTLPFRTSNNAVCEAMVNGQSFVYSFGGIDTSKAYSGIHQRSFKYAVATDNWTEIASLPDTLGKIAMGASFVKGKIYIFGGYHVLQNGSEISSNRVHIYNPTTDNFESDGTNIPLAIDDHVQGVYKDSLIYLITGWSNTGNVTNVQIYNPSLDQWTIGTSLPNTSFFKAFGASGYIVGDTIYYYGGVQPFTARRYMRKGYINSSDPTNISWTYEGEAPGDPSYRAACSAQGNTVFWVGGAAIAYNFDGLAYTNSAGVEPSTRILHYDAAQQQYVDDVQQPYGVMDLRGIAHLGNGKWIIAGGMDSNQVVSNRTFLLENSTIGLPEVENVLFTVQDNGHQVKITVVPNQTYFLRDATGRMVGKWSGQNEISLNRDEFDQGIYIFGNEETQLRVWL